MYDKSSFVMLLIQPSWFPCTYSQESKGSNTQGMVLAIPICNLQRCLARSIFCHLELVLFYTVKFYLASCVIIHLKVDVAGSNPSKSSLVQFVRRTVIDKIISNRFIKFSFRITIPTLMYFTSVSKIYRRVTINFCNSNIPITVACLTNNVL